MAVESIGYAVQWRRIARRALPDGQLARHHRKPETLLRSNSRGNILSGIAHKMAEEFE
jgi:hypothetical protein